MIVVQELDEQGVQGALIRPLRSTQRVRVVEHDAVTDLNRLAPPGVHDLLVDEANGAINLSERVLVRRVEEDHRLGGLQEPVQQSSVTTTV